MNIIEATKKAMEENKAITNPETNEAGIVFVPTNSGPLDIVIVGTKPFVTGGKEKMPTPSRYWHPRGEDILREDWELF